MGTQIHPEQNPSNNSQESSEQTTQPSTQTETGQPTQTQPANTTAPTNVTDLNLLAFRTAERERARLEEENRQLQQRLQTERKPQDFSSYNERFITEPATATADITRQIVQDEIRNAFAPLQNDFVQMRRDSAYTALKNQVRVAYPQFNQIEASVDQIMAGNEPTVQAIQAAIRIVIGELAMQGKWNPTTQTNSPTPNAPIQTVPAQLSPAPPAPPRQMNNNQARPLSELEKRVARENNMSDDEFLSWMNADSKDIATTNIGRPPQK